MPRGRAGRPLPPGPGPPPAATPILPAYCRVAATLRPSADSDIRIEIWMPVDWNGKFLGVGGGGWAGSISFPPMSTALQERYATASTDTGHQEPNGMFALGHPEKIVDFGYRAIHETAVKSKAIIKAFYGRDARLSYFQGCSTGGRQALIEATRYPADFDAIIAGAPANPQIHLHTSAISRTMDFRKIEGLTMTPGKLALLYKAVMAACDANDGVKDGLLNDPSKCKFDPATLLCKAVDADDCLNPAQLAAVNRQYADSKTRKGEIIWTGLTFGTELTWGYFGAGGTGPPGAFSLDTVRILGYQNPDWDWRTFDLDRETAVTDEKAGFIDAHKTDLKEFKDRGGKLLLYHGWSDNAIPPGNTVNFYNRVLATMGTKQNDWMRLFLVPGMQHCGGGPGPNQLSYLGALERWRESNIAPDSLLAIHVTNNSVDMTRPICAYPQVARYKGVGSTNDAANFACQ